MTAFQFPGTEGLLAGDVLYTAYLRPDSGRDWILQCSQNDRYEHRDSALEPPFPVHALRPELTLPPEVDYMVIHGIVNAEGRFENLAIIGDQPVSPNPDEFLRALSEWQLRPAMVDGHPVAVDILLIVPPNRTDMAIDTPPLR